MIKRITAFGLVLMLMASIPITTSAACNVQQSETYVTQIVFGDNALQRQSDDNVKLLMDALYLCSEQSDNQGQEKIDNLKLHKVRKVPSLSTINIKNDCLLDCAHNSWEYEYKNNVEVKIARKKILNNSVNKVFDFGFINNLFGSSSGECESFSALLYYAHILSDYLASDPAETTANVKGKSVEGYSGQPYVTINGDKPDFMAQEKKNIRSYYEYSGMDSYGRCGVAYACLDKEDVINAGPRKSIDNITPSGWNFDKYPNIVNAGVAYLYNRCHLIAHGLGGADDKNNLITGTRYMNAYIMEPFERDVMKYIEKTGNHVLYRVTPIYKNDNLVASGVQMEAYSIEDSGEGICFNRYCYNVQPGVRINYMNGKSEISDVTFEKDNVLPFTTYNPSEQNPDLIYEMKKHLKILFDDSDTKMTYDSMISQIDAIATDARKVVTNDENPAKCYLETKKLEYEYFEVLKTYVPMMLEKQEFFKSAFQ